MVKNSIKILKSFSVCMICFLLLAECHQSRKIKIATSLEGSAAERIGIELSKYLNNSGWEVEVLSGPEYDGLHNINLIEQGLVDFAFVSNGLKQTVDSKNIQTVLPLYPKLNFIIYKSGLDPKSLDDLITNNNVLIYEDDESFYLDLFNYFGLNTKNLSYRKIFPNQSI